MAAYGDTNGAAPENDHTCTIESGSEYDFDGDQECDSDDGFAMSPSKPYAEDAKSADELSLAKRLGRADTVATPVTNVFDTHELLERILGKLHPFDLARAARVCSQWQDMVDSSKKLQRALFLLPVQGTLAYWHPDSVPPNQDRFPGLLNQPTRPSPSSSSSGGGIWSSSPYSIEPIRVFVNPLALARPDLFLPGGQQGTIPTTGGFNYRTTDPSTFTHRTTDLTTGASYTTTTNLATGASYNTATTSFAATPAHSPPKPIPDFFGKAWQRMLFTQPPMGDVTLRWRSQYEWSSDGPAITHEAENELFKAVSMVQMRMLAREMLGEGVRVDGFEEVETLCCGEDLEL